MDITYGDVVINGYLANEHGDPIAQVIKAMEDITYSRDGFNTGGYQMTKVKLTISITE